jgi:hypothetical protein
MRPAVMGARSRLPERACRESLAEMERECTAHLPSRPPNPRAALGFRARLYHSGWDVARVERSETREGAQSLASPSAIGPVGSDTAGRGAAAARQFNVSVVAAQSALRLLCSIEKNPPSRLPRLVMPDFLHISAKSAKAVATINKALAISN